MNRLVMGQKNACYIGQRAALVTYSNSNLAAFLADERIDSYSLLLEQAETGTGSCDDVLNSESLKDLSEVELCAKFGLNPDILQKEFSQLFESILQVFRFLKTGDVETYQDSEKLSPAEIFDDGSLSRDITQTLDLATILRMLILIHDKFKTTLLFSISF